MRVSEGQHQLKLVSDGTPQGTSVTLEDGTALKNVMEASYRVTSTELGVLTIEILCVPVTVDAAAIPEVALVCPVCGHVDTHTCS
jgi:hypothetical protein